MQDLHGHVVTQSAQAFVTSFLVRCLRSNIEHMQSADSADIATLDVSRILPRYRHSQKRLLLIDFEGTIWQRDPAKLALRGEFDPPKEAIDALNKLTEDPKNDVWLLSGLQVKGALERIATAAPKISLVLCSSGVSSGHSTLISMPYEDPVGHNGSSSSTWRTATVRVCCVRVGCNLARVIYRLILRYRSMLYVSCMLFEPDPGPLPVSVRIEAC